MVLTLVSIKGTLYSHKAFCLSWSTDLMSSFIASNNILFCFIQTEKYWSDFQISTEPHILMITCQGGLQVLILNRLQPQRWVNVGVVSRVAGVRIIEFQRWQVSYRTCSILLTALGVLLFQRVMSPRWVKQTNWAFTPEPEEPHEILIFTSMKAF